MSSGRRRPERSDGITVFTVAVLPLLAQRFTRILAYALAFVAVMLAVEALLVQPLERHIARWRPRTA